MSFAVACVCRGRWPDLSFLQWPQACVSSRSPKWSALQAGLTSQHSSCSPPLLLQASHGSLLGKRKAAEEPAETTSPFNSPPHMPIVPNGVSRSQVWQHSPVSNTRL